MTTIYHKCMPSLEKPAGQVVALVPLQIQVITIGTQNGKEFYPLVTNISPENLIIGSPTWKCVACGKILTVEELSSEVYLDCPYCGDFHLLRDSVSTSYTPPLGKRCLEKLIDAGKFSSTARRYDFIAALMSIKMTSK